MSRENLAQFMIRVASSEELQARIGEEVTGDDLVAIGTEQGWEFTTEDLLAASELSDEELEQVAGGLGAQWAARASKLRLRRASGGSAMQGVRFSFEEIRVT